MQVTVDIPDQFARDLVPEGCDPARVLLEEAVAAAYREGRLTTEQVRVLLGFGYFMQVDSFLAKHEIYDYSVEDFEKDIATLEQLPSGRKALSRT
ncbi:Uncharacterised protein family (UPF0175) [Granulicella rosea]|uniref:Uncharacterized protein family (UPF0175) n=1 Tax=Granulicella rosea TaxID=474952 RepID=A0A239D980_9BACT|nr:UPF0175 family protein [Granulicella rosea]SNS28421.1 Uncharacterised protein family (UPF0175) [Granulicella rosea]